MFKTALHFSLTVKQRIQLSLNIPTSSIYTWAAHVCKMNVRSPSSDWLSFWLQLHAALYSLDSDWCGIMSALLTNHNTESELQVATPLKHCG